MRYFLLVLLLVCFTSAETIEQTIIAALAHSEQYLAAVNLQRQAEESQLSIQRKYWPLLKYDYSYKYVSDVAKVETPLMSFDMGVKESYDNGLTLSWLVFDGFAREAKLSKASLTAKLAELFQYKTKREVAFNAVQYYLAVAQYAAQQKELIMAKSRIEAQRKRLLVMLEQGQSISLDVLSLDLQLSEYDQQLLLVRTQSAMAEDKLQDLAGKIQVNVFVPSLPKDVPDLAWEAIPAWQEILYQEQVNDMSEIIALAGFYPELSIYGSARTGKPGVDALENKWMSYQTMGVGLQWLLWDWGGRSAEVAAQDYSARALEQHKQELKKKINTQYTAALREYKMLQQQLELYVFSKEIAKKRADIYAAKYAQGLVSTTDYIQAQQDYALAGLKVVSCSYTVYLKAIELDYLSGQEIHKWRVS